ncbi:hypothetical protein [Glycomyces sp. NRRL B-16210]|uniref:hypothetical protein n=1 Tax=Glycomyces sp. NRRL B-16210 TaxID=1463821 RepID=UPI0004BE7BFB|nr:hypothetical protein [Glycomyces sp. NRRL B-16210]
MSRIQAVVISVIGLFVAGWLIAYSIGGDSDDETQPVVESTEPSPSASPLPPPVIFVYEEDMHPCPEVEEVIGMESNDFDGSYRYEEQRSFYPDTAANRHHAECSYLARQNEDGTERVTSDVVEVGISVMIDDALLDIREVDTGVVGPASFDGWRFDEWNLYPGAGPGGDCFRDAETLWLCSDTIEGQQLTTDFDGDYGNLSLRITVGLGTADTDRDMEAWAEAVTAEVADLVLARLPTE